LSREKLNILYFFYKGRQWVVEKGADLRFSGQGASGGIGKKELICFYLMFKLMGLLSTNLLATPGFASQP